MKRTKICVIASVFIIIFFYISFNVYHNNKKIEGIDLYTNNYIDTPLETISLDELRSVYEQNVEEIKNGKYDNLSADNPVVTITQADSVCNIKETSNDWYKDVDMLELVEEELDIIKQLIGEDINMDYVVDDTSWYYIDDQYNLHYPTYSETVESIKSGTYTPNDFVAQYCTYPYLAYIGVTLGGDDLRYCHVPCDLDYVVFMKGKLYEISDVTTDDISAQYDPIAVYYKNGYGLEDEYELLNGKISIRESIEFVENYFKNKYPYNFDEKIKQVVYKVEVFDIGNGIHALEFSIIREFGGLLTDSGNTSENVDTELMTYAKDSTRIIMVETDDIDMRIGTGNAKRMQYVGKPIKKVVSLDSALEKISNSLGKNSKYKIEEISMIFRRKIVNDTLYQQEYTGIPCWKIRCTNIADGRETRFYINLKDGKLEYYLS